MSMRFYVNNLVKDAVITASENNAQFPSSNLKDDRRSKVYRSLTSSCNIVFDFGSVKDINAIAIVDSKQSSFGFTTATIELNSTNSWGSPAVSQALTIDSQTGWVNFNWSATQSYRYARLVLTNPTAPIELSKLFIGKDTFIEGVCFSYPINFRYNNRSSVVVNRYGQKFIDEILSQKELSGQIPSMTKSELDVLLEVIDYASYTKPIWFYMEATNLMVDVNRMNGYYYLNDDPEMVLNTGNYWSVSLNLVEGT